MTQKIYKYTLQKVEITEVVMPKNAKILTAQEQFGNVCVWCLVDPLADTEIRRFGIYATGWPISCLDSINMKYVATFQSMGGSLVHHLFEHMEKANA